MGDHELPPNVADALVRASEACDALDGDTNFQSKARAFVEKAAEQLQRSDAGAKPTFREAALHRADDLRGGATRHKRARVFAAMDELLAAGWPADDDAERKRRQRRSQADTAAAARLALPDYAHALPPPPARALPQTALATLGASRAPSQERRARALVRSRALASVADVSIRSRHVRTADAATAAPPALPGHARTTADAPVAHTATTPGAIALAPAARLSRPRRRTSLPTAARVHTRTASASSFESMLSALWSSIETATRDADALLVDQARTYHPMTSHNNA